MICKNKETWMNMIKKKTMSVKMKYSISEMYIIKTWERRMWKHYLLTDIYTCITETLLRLHNSDWVYWIKLACVYITHFQLNSSHNNQPFHTLHAYGTSNCISEIWPKKQGQCHSGHLTTHCSGGSCIQRMVFVKMCNIV